MLLLGTAGARDGLYLQGGTGRRCQLLVCVQCSWGAYFCKVLEVQKVKGEAVCYGITNQIDAYCQKVNQKLLELT